MLKFLGLLMSICHILMAISAVKAHAETEPVISVAVNDFLPYSGVIDGKVAGIDVILVEKLATRLGLRVEYRQCPLARCLEQLKTGEIDLLPGVYRNAEREEFMVFLNPPYVEQTRKVFYVNRGSNVSIERYEDLRPLAIGTRQGSQYFDQFDQDENLRKEMLSRADLPFKMLAAKRLDTVIGDEVVSDFIIVMNGLTDEIAKTSYSVINDKQSYIALSRHSRFLPKLAEFNEALSELIAQGEVMRASRQFYRELNSLLEEPAN